MKIIFLDIDGVLNTERYIIKQVEQNNNVIPSFRIDYNFDPICMNNLKFIIDNVLNTKVVISSCWRTEKQNQATCESWQAILDNFRKFDIDTEAIIDITPWMWDKHRGDEIRHWLNTNQKLNIESFVIIDDDSDMCEYKETHLAQCKAFSGLTDSVMDKAIEILTIR